MATADPRSDYAPQIRNLDLGRAAGHRTIRALSALQRETRIGHITIQDLMTDPPQIIRNRTLIDVIVMCRPISLERGHPALALLGRKAIQDGVNLMLLLGSAPLTVRAWVAQNDPWAERRRLGGSKEKMAA